MGCFAQTVKSPQVCTVYIRCLHSGKTSTSALVYVEKKSKLKAEGVSSFNYITVRRQMLCKFKCRVHLTTDTSSFSPLSKKKWYRTKIFSISVKCWRPRYMVMVARWQEQSVQFNSQELLCVSVFTSFWGCDPWIWTHPMKSPRSSLPLLLYGAVHHTENGERKRAVTQYPSGLVVHRC